MQTVKATKFVKGQVCQDILNQINLIVHYTQSAIASDKKVKVGAYPFSRIVILPNFWKLECPLVEITEKNKKFLESDFVRRRKGEIPYLKRWFPSTVKAMIGDRIEVILYSKEQLQKEGDKRFSADWGIVAINVEKGKPSPVPPQTMVNNQMGIEFGGNGQKINVKEYEKSVRFWQKYAIKKRD